MKQKYTTVLLINNEGNEPKSYKLPTKLIEKSRLIITGACSALALIIIASAVLLVSVIMQSVKNGELNTQIAQMEQDLQLMDSMQIKNKVDNIEKRIYQINNFLQQKGIGIDSSVGGEIPDNREINPNIYGFYEDYTSSLVKEIRNIPLGLPHNGRITSDFGYRRNPYGGSSTEFHSGIDFKGSVGDPVKTTGDGKVILADWKGGFGRTVIVKHDFGYETLYGHMSSLNVMAGQTVRAGDVIGFVGSTGRSTGPHLHYELTRHGNEIDPGDYLHLK